MKKYLISSLLCLSLLASCSSDGAEGGVAGEVRARVAEIYDSVFAVYDRYADQMDDAFGDSVASFDRRFLSSDFRRLMARVHTIDSLYYPNEAGFYDYDYWILAQDWDSLGYVVDSVKVGSDTSATAFMRIRNFGTYSSLRLSMVQEGGHWVIDDFVTLTPEPYSLVEAMGEYIDVEHEADPN